MASWVANVMCWILGHLPAIEEVVDGVIRCARCNAVIGQVPKVSGDNHGQTPPVTGA